MSMQRWVGKNVWMEWAASAAPESGTTAVSSHIIPIFDNYVVIRKQRSANFPRYVSPKSSPTISPGMFLHAAVNLWYYCKIQHTTPTPGSVASNQANDHRGTESEICFSIYKRMKTGQQDEKPDTLPNTSFTKGRTEYRTPHIS